MKKKLLTALQAYFKGRKELLENTIKQNEGVKENGLSAEEIQRIKDDLARVTELVSSLQETEEGDDEETIRKKITEIITKGDSQVMNECKELVENSFRLWKIATENGAPTEAKTKEFKKLYENQIKALQTQLGVQVFENAAKYIHNVIDPKIVFMILSIVLFLIDIAARKFKWKWPHEIIRDKRNKAMSSTK